MAVRKSQNKWVISDDENEDEEVGLDVRELFALSKKKPGSDPQGNNSEDEEADKFHSASEKLDTSRASSQLTKRGSDTEKYFTADEDITSNTRLEDSLNAESVSDEDEDSESNIRPKVGRARCAVIYDDEDEGFDVIINKKEDIINNGSENSNTQKNLISDEEEEEEEEETTDNEVSQNNEPLPKRSKIVKPFSTVQGIQNSTEKNWWNQLLEPVPDSQKCKIDNCSFAPPDHKKHDLNIRSYTSYETRLIIKYLIYYDLIQYGKGLQVWKNFHSLGYLKHRSIESLNNHFKKYLLRDIKSYKLPKDIEEKFLKLQTSRKVY